LQPDQKFLLDAQLNLIKEDMEEGQNTKNAKV